ncbi:MAG TPA: hypothetical protein VIJ34_00075 [Acidimicrobiales bacterium]
MTAVIARDGWDIAVIAATLVTGVAAVVALIALIPIVRQLRRRPELAISWLFNGELWEEHAWVEIEPGASFTLGYGFTNVGDAGGESSLFNIVAPIRLALTDRDGNLGRRSGNPIVGGPCTYLKDERRFHAGLTWQTDCFVSLPDEPGLDQSGDETLLLDFSDERLNGSGKRIRWVSSLARWPWRMRKGVWLRIGASPELECLIGSRLATRQVRRIPRRTHDEPGRATLVKGTPGRQPG